MRMRLRFILLLSCWSALSYGVSSPPIDSRLTIHLTNAKGQSVKLSTPNLFTFEPITRIESKLDSSGTTVLQVPLSQTLFADVEIGETRYNLLLRPGDHLQIDDPDQSTGSRVRFSGQGAEAADYLLQLAAFRHQYEQRRTPSNPDAFQSGIDSIKKAYSSFHQHVVKTTSMDKPLLYLLEQKGKMQLLTDQLNYALAHSNPDTTKQTQQALKK